MDILRSLFEWGVVSAYESMSDAYDKRKKQLRKWRKLLLTK